MAEEPLRRYWDSNVFIALIKDEANRGQTVSAILDRAERGETEVLTSAFTLVEVVKTPDAAAPLTDAEEAVVASYFHHAGVFVMPFALDTAQEARKLVWRHGLRVPDAIHVASALRAGVHLLETYNGRLLRLAGEPELFSLRVREPTCEGQPPPDLA